MPKQSISKALAKKITERAESTKGIQHNGPDFDARHYVVIVKAKRGELWNCGYLKDASKGNVTPLFEIADKPGADFDEQCETVCHAVAAEWGTLPHFFDVRYVGTAQDPAPGRLTELFNIARTQNLSCVPVTSLFFSIAFQDAVREVNELDGRGVLLRLTVDDFTDPDGLLQSVEGLLNTLNILPAGVDILLDYGFRTTEAEVIQLSALHLALLPHINDWRTLTVASASFPESISTMPMNVWHSITRVDWLAWLAIRHQRTQRLIRVPTFGDYGVRGISSGEPIQNTPAPNLRYTSDQICLVRRGPKNQQQMTQIAQQLVALPEFMGANFSFGDQQIEARAAGGSPNDGAAEHWILWCMNHHVEFVVQQLANLP